MIARTYSLGRAEVLLLRRNKTLLFTALLVPLGLVGALATAGDGGAPDDSEAATMVGLFIGMVLLFVVYYTVLSGSVARREEGVLQRLRTGEASDAEILTATSLPGSVVALVQVLLFAAVGGVVLGLPVPHNPVIVLFAVLLGAAVFAVVALLTAVISRTVESVQITSLPVLAVCLFGAGLVVPLEELPPAVERICGFTPLAAVLELVRDGWLGPVDWVSAAGQTGILLAWIAAGVLLIRTSFRWSPRA
ncbi:ABC transporter permease [Cryptosporangium aurantiacum]|uniref:Transport permease protein n=1 Tax=Cryptosporangium aurantiacum TaxID=134849 RepID=A0A1M7J899_9ACTN|nr:ABC transporter permease [Cryptosporangium aurantiacum]SHM49235.1 ABC-2 type transport system permease protein [Cryptosporangium aurantiacum]